MSLNRDKSVDSVASHFEHGRLVRCLRAIFLIYLTALLAWFVPAHTRGRLPMAQGPVAESCCSDDATPRSSEPSQKDKANCAVCFWAAGILPQVATVPDVRPVDIALIETRQALDQCSVWFIPNESIPRGPPALQG